MKTKQTTKTPVQKTALSFRKDSYRALMLKALENGKPKTAEQLVKVVGAPASALKNRTPIQFVRPIIDQFKAAKIKVVSPETGVYQLAGKRAA